MDFLFKKNTRLNFFYIILLLTLIYFPSGRGVFAQQSSQITGVIVDSESKLPLSGVSVKVNGTKRSLVSDKDGRYDILIEDNSKSLTFSFVGYVSKTLSIKEKLTELNVELVSESNNIDEVVVTGIFERRKESFTGSTNTVSGEQLRAIGNQNLIQSLRTLDPSFILVDNNAMGSDPNSLARVELRGKTSVSSNTNNGVLTDQFAIDPNLPLFILDGFESSLRQVTDLDINRIGSVTILKDAASTALYGARAANGVVVVETIKPKAGDLIVTYSGDYTVSFPDLRDYNLMNAEEKLEFERLAGRYKGDRYFSDYVDLQNYYNQRLADVRKGVNTYWLVEPLREIGVTNGHSLYISGGSEEFQYGVGTTRKYNQGVMKGSGRDNWGGSIDISYRKSNFNIFNSSFINGVKSDNSPYGSFSIYARMNPYYRKDNVFEKFLETNPGGLIKNVEDYSQNPIYNALQNSESYNKTLSLQNRLGFNYDVNSVLRVLGSFQISKDISSSVNFISPLDTRYDSAPLLQKGEYIKRNSEGLSYNANIGFAYSSMIFKDHILTLNGRGEIQESNNTSDGYDAIGFPLGASGNPVFASSYRLNSKPYVYMMPKTRRLNFLTSLNYVINNRYYIDATYRIDGSTAFGSNKRYSPFWSTGIGWSVHNEKFAIDNVSWLNTLQLKFNIGVTGNQAFGSFMSTTVYQLEQNTNYFNQGLYHTSLGNPNLEWQKTKQSNLSIDMGVLNNRITANLSAYKKITNPLIISMDVPGSNGISNYPTNLANLTVDGVEATVKYSPIMNFDKRFIWTLGIMGSAYQSYYGGIGAKLNALNEQQRKSNSVERYIDGNSPDDIWGVKSLGIDFSSGREVFLKKDGGYTFDYEYHDIVKLGNTRPFSEGILSSNVKVKDFTFNIHLRYNLGSYRFNSAMYEKVENISLSDLAYNQDKRALELRWRNPGDVSQFKSISLTEYSPISSRFVQKENFLSGESISVGYDLYSSSSKFLRSAKLRSLRLNAFMNNIFRLSNILAERGIDYPFANTMSFSMKASF